MTKILWTGGWDSTFRILQLVLLEKKSIQPIYILDQDRKSNRIELETIYKIINLISEKHPEVSGKINDPIVVDKSTITIDENIKDSYKKICTIKKIGSQYLWLASYCKQNNFKEVELGIEKDDNQTSFFNYFLNPYLESKSTYQSEISREIDTIFNYFDYKIVAFSKQDILNTSQENGWMDIMNLTWFCHTPKRNKPCGKCKPCLTVFKEGLRYRIPYYRRLFSYIKLLKNRIKKTS